MRSEIGAAVIWVISSFVLAAAIAPWLYQAGKAFAEFTAAGDFPRLIESVGGSCSRAGFGRYFNRSLLLAALVLLPFLLRRLRFLRADGSGAAKRLWQKLPWKTALIQTLAGCLIAIGVLWGFASLLESMGYFAASEKPVAIGRVLSQVLVSAVGVSLVEECSSVGCCWDCGFAMRDRLPPASVLRCCLRCCILSNRRWVGACLIPRIG